MCLGVSLFEFFLIGTLCAFTNLANKLDIQVQEAQRIPNKMNPNERTGENSRKMLNEMKASSLRDTEFKALVMRILNEFRRRTNDLSEKLNKEIVSIKKDIETIQKKQK